MGALMLAVIANFELKNKSISLSEVLDYPSFDLLDTFFKY